MQLRTAHVDSSSVQASALRSTNVCPSPLVFIKLTVHAQITTVLCIHCTMLRLLCPDTGFHMTQFMANQCFFSLFSSLCMTGQSVQQVLEINHRCFEDLLHGPSMFAVKAKIYGVLYNQASSIAFDETSSYWSALKSS